jgi:hypothetical protein
LGWVVLVTVCPLRVPSERALQICRVLADEQTAVEQAEQVDVARLFANYPLHHQQQAHAFLVAVVNENAAG